MTPTMAENSVEIKDKARSLPISNWENCQVLNQSVLTLVWLDCFSSASIILMMLVFPVPQSPWIPMVIGVLQLVMKRLKPE